MEVCYLHNTTTTTTTDNTDNTDNSSGEGCIFQLHLARRMVPDCLWASIDVLMGQKRWFEDGNRWQ
jgi:hypothetical protein